MPDPDEDQSPGGTGLSQSTGRNLLSTDHLARFLPRFQQANHIYIGYSGGLDSTVLLHLLCKLMPVNRITAVHINHQLSENAENWQNHCAAQCRSLGVAFIAEKVRAENVGKGLEDAARHARYGVFEALLGAEDLLLLAHHMDDQAETVLYRLLRGSGLRGLSGMPMERKVGKGVLLRPLLEFRRADLANYGRHHALRWIEDESNHALAFDRNYLRHQVLPVIAARWPGYDASIAHTANLAAASESLNNQLAELDLEALRLGKARRGWAIDVPGSDVYSEQRIDNLLRRWCLNFAGVAPSGNILASLREELIDAGTDAQPLVQWQGLEVRRFNARIYLAALLPEFSPEVIPFSVSKISELPGAIPLSGGMHLEYRLVEGRGVALRDINAQWHLRFREGGERCKPVGRNGSNTLKKLFQEYHLEPWLRDRVPLVYRDDQLVAVGDLWICDGCEVKDGEAGVVFQWSFNDG